MESKTQPDLPPEISDKITVVHDDPVDITVDDIDLSAFDERHHRAIIDLVPIIVRWHNMPLIYDDFDTHTERRIWREQLENEYGEGSDEIKFIETNKLRGNKMTNVISSIYPLIKTGAFDEGEQERIKNEVSELVTILQLLLFISGKKIESITEILEILSSNEIRFNEEEFPVTAKDFLVDLRLHVLRRLEVVSLEVINKFVDEEKKEDRLMVKAAVDPGDNAEFQDMVVSPFGSEMLAVIVDKVNDVKTLILRILEFGKKKG